MTKILKRILYTILSLVAIILLAGLILAYLPVKSIVKQKGITPEEAAIMRQEFKEPHHEIKTDGETLFMRRWNPDSIDPNKKDIAVLILHGVTAHSGAYDWLVCLSPKGAIQPLVWITGGMAYPVATGRIIPIKWYG